MQSGYQGGKNLLCFQQTDLTIYFVGTEPTPQSASGNCWIRFSQLEDCGTSGVQVLGFASKTTEPMWPTPLLTHRSRYQHWQPLGTCSAHVPLHRRQHFFLFNIYIAAKPDWRSSVFYWSSLTPLAHLFLSRLHFLLAMSKNPERGAVMKYKYSPKHKTTRIHIHIYMCLQRWWKTAKDAHRFHSRGWSSFSPRRLVPPASAVNCCQSTASFTSFVLQ